MAGGQETGVDGRRRCVDFEEKKMSEALLPAVTEFEVNYQ